MQNTWKTQWTTLKAARSGLADRIPIMRGARRPKQSTMTLEIKIELGWLTTMISFHSTYYLLKAYVSHSTNGHKFSFGWQSSTVTHTSSTTVPAGQLPLLSSMPCVGKNRTWCRLPRFRNLWDTKKERVPCRNLPTTTTVIAGSILCLLQAAFDRFVRTDN